MKSQLLLLGMLFAVAIFLISCSPQEELTEEELESLSDEELDLAMQEGSTAIAGEAFQKLPAKRQDVLRKVSKSPFSCTESTNTIILSSDSFTKPMTKFSCAFKGTQVVERVCKGSGYKTIVRERCLTGCKEGVCIQESPVRLPAENNIEVVGDEAAAVEVTSQTTQDEGQPVTTVTVEVNQEPLVEIEAAPGSDLSGVTVQKEESKVVVTGVEGLAHFLYVDNTRNAGVFVCPEAGNLAAVTSGCSSEVRYSHVQCADSSFTACQVVGQQYKVEVSGSGADQAGECNTGETRTSCSGNNLIVTQTCTNGFWGGNSTQSCLSGKVCSDGQCVAPPPECVDNSGCQLGFSCIEGACTRANSQCGGRICPGISTCELEESVTENQTTVSNPVCTCSNDLECGNGRSCTDGKCV